MSNKNEYGGLCFMKCFECGSRCITVYLDADNMPLESRDVKIAAVAKLCECGWMSHPTKIPEKI